MLQLNFFVSLLGTHLLSTVYRHGAPSDPLVSPYLTAILLFPQRVYTSLVKWDGGGWGEGREWDPREKTEWELKLQGSGDNRTVSGMKMQDIYKLN